MKTKMIPFLLYVLCVSGVFAQTQPTIPPPPMASVPIPILLPPTTPPISGEVGGGGSGDALPTIIQLALPTDSVESLTTYALELVGRGQLLVQGNPTVYTEGSKTYADFIGTDTAGILKQMAKVPMKWEALGLNDWFQVNARLTTEDYIPLFSGGTGFRITKSGNSYTVPESARTPKMYLESEIPIFLPSVRYGFIAERNADGELTSEPFGLDVDYQRGFFKFPTYFAGKKGELVAYVSVPGLPGTSPSPSSVPLVFDLQTGSVKPTISVDNTTFDVGIEDVFFAEVSTSDPTDISVTATSGRNPVLQLTVTASVNLINIKVYGVVAGGGVEGAGRYHSRPKGSQIETIGALRAGTLTVFNLPVGIYYFSFDGFPSYGRNAGDRFGRPGRYGGKG